MQTDTDETGPIQKIATGISGFEYVSMGGLPRGRTTLVSGNAGCGKTVLRRSFSPKAFAGASPVCS